MSIFDEATTNQETGSYMIESEGTSQANVEAQIRAFIVGNFYVPDPAALASEDSFLDRGIIDSTGVLEMIHFLESTYGFTVEDEEMVPENLDSVARIVLYVDRKRAS